MILSLIKRLAMMVWNLIYSRKWYFLGLALLYIFNIDEYFQYDFDGPEFGVAMIIFELTMFLTAYLFKRNYGINERRKITKLKKQLQTIDQKTDLREYILISREIKKLEKIPTSLYPSGASFFIRSILPNILFFHKYVCTFPNNNFWSPFQSIVSFPHSSSPNEIKVGFSFFWNSLLYFDNYIIKCLPYE
ncbi:hypothetical protein TRFO_11851 [Tritrichomonas foetus]|uniref:Uncharacterized protein n=1 Tax=Tritrichomonas foetus TaxID=1144522 RepID=A0A1J4J1M4_9EUKA|nr:hypothetical protein TRFO_11851 [Tritrichomonas foetus]|eukprot:OHS93424.1 hypothetical protein TRFO_11851 [Tritrichomonas foetus]